MINEKKNIYRGAAYYTYDNRNIKDSLTPIMNAERVKTQTQFENEIYHTKNQPIKVNKINALYEKKNPFENSEKFDDYDDLKKQYRYFKRGVVQDSVQIDLIKEKEKSIRDLENRGLNLQLSKGGRNIVEYKNALQRRLMTQLDKVKSF